MINILFCHFVDCFNNYLLLYVSVLVGTISKKSLIILVTLEIDNMLYLVKLNTPAD